MIQQLRNGEVIVIQFENGQAIVITGRELGGEVALCHANGVEVRA